MFSHSHDIAHFGGFADLFNGVNVVQQVNHVGDLVMAEDGIQVALKDSEDDPDM